MLEYDRIDISEGIDVDKTNLSKECDICHYWYFRNIGFKCEPYLCNGCHDLMQKAIIFNNIAIVYIKGNAYRIHFWYVSKNGAINIMNGYNLVDKRGVNPCLISLAPSFGLCFVTFSDYFLKCINNSKSSFVLESNNPCLFTKQINCTQ